MCGISGIYNYVDASLSESVVSNMNDCLAHRGPDARGIYKCDRVILGHRRLSIIDTSKEGNQPFSSEDEQLTIVFNGELYNYIELKKELSSEYNFRTSSDTEVVLAAYQKWGIACLQKFNGMFAFALYEKQTDTLFLVRDRLGIKPLYYSETAHGFIFASEIRAILSSGFVEKKISKQALADYLHYQTVHAPDTIIDGVKMLMPGHYMMLSAAEKKSVCYWNTIDHTEKNREESIESIQKNVHHLLQRSVEMQMRADVPFGAFLSGGIDSSIIVGLMSTISEQPINTFSITFHEKEFDESPYSSIIAKKFNTRHNPIQLRATDFLKLIPEALQAMDHPGGDGPNTYVVSKMTREAGVKMALSGLGGDELFAGYNIFTRMKRIEDNNWINLFPQAVRKLAGQLLVKARPSVSSEKIAEVLSQKRLDFAHVYPLSRQILAESTIQSLLVDGFNYVNPVTAVTQEISKSQLPILSKVSAAEMASYMQNVLLRDSDQMSMAHALEIRVPFLDHELIEYTLGILDKHKFPSSPKKLLTDSFAGLLPHEIIHRPKMGFTFPWPVWMRGELRTFCEENLQALQQLESIRMGGVNDLWNRFLNQDNFITWSRIWPLVVLGHWVKQHDVH